MKNLLIILTLLFVFNANAQNTNINKVNQLVTGGGHNFEVIGIESYAFIDSLFSHFPQTKRKGYIWKFKNVHVPGIENPVTLQVHQGLSGGSVNNNVDTTICKPGSYFNTFTSEKYKQKRLSQSPASESPAILIYIKRGRNYVVSSKSESELIRNYLLSIYEE